MHAQKIDTTKVKLEIDSLIKISRDLTINHKFDEALKNIELAKNKAQSVFGMYSAIFSNCVFNEGRMLHFQNDYPNAESMYLKAKSIREIVLGKENPDYAFSLHNLAKLYVDMGLYQKAEPLYLEAKRIRENVLGNEHADYASSLDALANYYSDLGQYEKAEPLYLEAISIRKKVLGVENSDYAASLNNLAILYSEIGQFEKAELLHMEAKDIREKVLGKESPRYAWSLNNLALVYQEMGKYELAELLHLEAKAIREKVLGTDNPDYAASLNNLGNLYTDLGQYEKAVEFHLEAKDIREKILGKEHPDYSKSLINLALAYSNLDQFEKAENLYIEAKFILEKVLGQDNKLYANCIINLAGLYIVMHQYKKAELLYFEVKSMIEKNVGKENPFYAIILNGLGVVYSLMGQYVKAEPLMLEAKEIRKNILGNEHPDYSNSLDNLGLLYINMGRYDEASKYIKESQIINQSLMTRSVYYLSERELADYTNTFLTNISTLLNYSLFLSFNKINTDFLNGISYDNALFYKGFLLSSSYQINTLITSSNVGKEISKKLQDYQRRLYKEYSISKMERDSELVSELEEKVNNSEKELARAISGYKEAKEQISWKDVQSKLKPGEVAIEFTHFQYNIPIPTDSIFYSALVLLPGDSSPQYVTLFEEKELMFLLSADSIRREEYVANLYQPYQHAKNNFNGHHNKTLYELIWMPLESKLKGINTVYFSPSGLLYRINQNAISITYKTILSDKFKLVQLGSTRQLVNNDKSKESLPTSAYLFGGINFDIDSTDSITSIKNSDNISISMRSELSFSDSDSSLRGETFNYLNGSEKEIKMIQTIFKKTGINSTLFHGNDATEGSFKKLGSYPSDSFELNSSRIIHISTHGYFFPDPKEKDANFQMSVSSQHEPVFKISEHPMIRSGLILSGGNHAWKTGKPFRPEMEDGILTSYEISKLNLRNTELVILSACETGLGTIEGNEGVYGLQRAFKIAGVKNLIMSLWEVPDNQTSELMQLFYENWVVKKMNIRDSLIAAQNIIRKKGLSPFNWAGFVLVE